MSGLVVVDPSLAISWVVEEDQTESANGLLAAWMQQGTSRVAPALFAVEAASTLMKKVRAGEVDSADVPTSLSVLFGAVKVVPDDVMLIVRAFAIAYELGQRRVYDSLYAALAEREGAEFWTGDKRFHNAASGRYPWVHWVGEFTPPAGEC